MINYNINRITKWKLINKIQQDFWKRWNNEYLNTLQKRNIHSLNPVALRYIGAFHSSNGRTHT